MRELGQVFYGICVLPELGRKQHLQSSLQTTSIVATKDPPPRTRSSNNRGVGVDLDQVFLHILHILHI